MMIAVSLSAGDAISGFDVGPSVKDAIGELLDSKETYAPSSSQQTYTPDYFMDMKYAVMHDARWILAGGTHLLGGKAHKTALFSGGSELFAHIGNSFQAILRYYAQFQKARELVGMVQAMSGFMDNFRIRTNVYKLIPNIVISEPGDPFGPTSRSFIVGFCPKHDDSWRSDGTIYLDNPYISSASGLKVFELKYPRSWDDIKIDGSIWAAENPDEAEMQKQMLAGFYDGVTSAGRYLTSVGVDNNVELSVGRLSPKNLALSKAKTIDKRIEALIKQRLFYENAIASPTSDAGQALGAYSAEEILRMEGALDNEIKRLETQKASALGLEISKQQGWVEKANFVHQILSKLEAPERRIAIARLSERFKKYQNCWGNPDFMVLQPEYTGNPQLDRWIDLIWKAITILSRGEVPPPEAKAGAKGAELQSIVTKAMYRQLTYEELAGIRQLLAGEIMQNQQKTGMKQIDAMKGEIERTIGVIEQKAEALKRLKAMNDAMETFCSTHPQASWALK